jgi:hypothetical protein
MSCASPLQLELEQAEVMNDPPVQPATTVLSELDRLLVELQTKLADVTPETQTRSKWQEKLDRREEVWMEMRPTFLNGGEIVPGLPT